MTWTTECALDPTTQGQPFR